MRNTSHPNTKGETMRHQVISEKLAQHYQAEVIQGKGGFWVKDHGFVSLAKARKMTSIPASPRPRRKQLLPYGDYATVAMLNQARK